MILSIKKVLIQKSFNDVSKNSIAYWLAIRRGDNMPAMIRMKGRAANIAYKILGYPDNIRKNKNRNDKKNRQIDQELTSRVR